MWSSAIRAAKWRALMQLRPLVLGSRQHMQAGSALRLRPAQHHGQQLPLVSSAKMQLKRQWRPTLLEQPPRTPSASRSKALCMPQCSSRLMAKAAC